MSEQKRKKIIGGTEIERQNNHRYANYHILTGNYDDIITKRIVSIITDYEKLQTELAQLKAEKSGEWASSGNGITKRTICSHCQKEKNGLGYTKYCSECGAKMKKAENQ